MMVTVFSGSSVHLWTDPTWFESCMTTFQFFSKLRASTFDSVFENGEFPVFFFILSVNYSSK